MFSYVEFPSWINPQVIPGFPVRWYAVMYLAAFAITYVLFRKECREGALGGMDADTGTTLFLYVIVALILGGRLGYTLLYDPSFYFWKHPWMIFWPFRNGRFTGLPGMSYHGAVVLGCVGGLLFGKKYGYRFLDLADAIFVAVPLGFTLGRIGNFINGELWGRCTGSAYGMIFPEAPGFSTGAEWVRQAADAAGIKYSVGDVISLPRHPSQLYEAFFEGIFLFCVLWFLVRPLVEKKKIGRGFIFGAYLGGYGLIRFIIEYFREPDSQLGFVVALGKETEPTALFRSLLNFSMGQILCLIMIAAGAAYMVHACKIPPTDYGKGKKKNKQKKTTGKR